MAKPSIFSSNYKKEVRKKRNRRIAILITVLLVAVGVTVFFVESDSISNIVKSFKKKDEPKKVEETKTQEEENKEDVKIEEEKNNDIEVNLLNNYNITLEVDKNKTIVSVKNENPSLDAIVNPSNNAVLFYDKDNQTMALVDNEGNVKDITYTQYVSSKGGVNTRDAVLGSNPAFNWTRNPKFVSDNLIVYTSAVPWFKDEVYLWGYNVTENKHYTISVGGSSLFGGKEVSIEDMVEGKGLKVLVNNVAYYVTETGEVVGE